MRKALFVATLSAVTVTLPKVRRPSVPSAPRTPAPTAANVGVATAAALLKSAASWPLLEAAAVMIW